MSQYLRFVAGESINLDGLTLPGIVTGTEVTGDFDLEKKRLEGTSFRTKLSKGYKDAVVVISLEILPGDTPVGAQIKQIEAAFKVNYAGAKPKPQRIVNPHLDARGVTTVLFKRFVTRETNEDDAVLATLEFVEYEPLVAKTERGRTPPTTSGPQALPAGQAGGGAGAGGAAAQPTPEERGAAAGVLSAEQAASFIPNTFGLPSSGGSQ